MNHIKKSMKKLPLIIVGIFALLVISAGSLPVQAANVGTSNTSTNTKVVGLNTGLVGYWTMDGKDVSTTTAIDRSGNSNSGILGNTGTTTTVGYSSATSGTSWVVPAGVTSVQVKSWGGGGGGGNGGSEVPSSGGGAGYAGGTITVTPGETLTVRVGGGGAYNRTGGVNGGGDGGSGSASANAGGGGGYSGIFRSSTALIVAAGGGGGGGQAGAGSGQSGAVGGGTTGGGSCGPTSMGGTQSAGGTGCPYDISGGNGASLSGGYGGSTVTGGGGGGGGYYGGGGGYGYQYTDGGGGQGGGGSSYTTGTSTTNTSGSGTSAGNNGDSDYAGSAGAGGATGASGTVGRTVLKYLYTSDMSTQGKIGQALSFNGSTQYSSTTDSSSLKPTAAISYGGWVYVPSKPSSIQSIIEKGVATSTGYGLFVTSDAKFCFMLTTAGGTEVNAGTTITTGQWHHVIVTYNSTTPLLYVDGASQSLASGTGCAASTQNGAITQGATSLNLGSRQGTSQFFNGKLDDARIYSRALSAQEVSQLYKQGGGVTVAKSNTSTNTKVVGLNAGLVGYWTMDGGKTSWASNTTQDSSVNGNTGTLISMSTTTSPTPGKIGQALKFDGTSQYLTVPTNAVFDVPIITVSAWVNTNDNTTANRSAVARDDGTNRDWILGMGAVGTFRFAIFVGNTQINAQSATGFSTNAWHHLVGTYDGTNVRLYVDGVNTVTTAQAGSLDTDTVGIGIGARSTGGSPWSGKVDDSRVYNRVLSAQEVKQLYTQGGGVTVAKSNTSTNTKAVGLNAGLVGYWTMDGKDTTIPYSMNGLVGYWNFDENTGTAAGDSANNGNTGSLVNTPTWATAKFGASALTFNGSTQYMTSGGTTGFDNKFANGITMAAWVKYPNFSQTQRTITIENNANTDYNYWLQALTDGKMMCGTVSASRTGTTVLSADTWYHVVCKTDYTSGGTKIYINGVDDGGTDSGVLAYTADNGPLDIGRLMSASTAYYGAVTIDDARVYNKAFTASDVTALYASTGPFTATTIDRSGSSNTGTLISSSTVLSNLPTAGKIGQALSFNGSTQYSSTTDSSSLKPTAAISYGGWVYVPSKPSSIQSIIEKGVATTAGYGLYVTSDPKFCFTLKTAGGTETNAGTSVTTGAWHHVIVTYDSTTPLLYVDGVSQSLASGTGCTASTQNGAITQSATTLNLGVRQGSSQFFNGKLDDARVYSRALSAKEVSHLYLTGK